MVPLRGLQLLCCAAVAAVALHVTAGLGHREDATRVAMSAFQAAQQGESAVEAALQAATAGLSEVKVVVARNDTLDQIFRRLEFSMSDLANIRALDSARQALDRLRPGDLLTFGRGRSVSHVGIYLGQGRFIHASVTSGRIIETTIERNARLFRRWQGARRLIAGEPDTTARGDS